MVSISLAPPDWIYSSVWNTKHGPNPQEDYIICSSVPIRWLATPRTSALCHWSLICPLFEIM